MPTSPKLFEPNTKALFQKWAERDFRADTTHMHWQARSFYRSLLQAAFFVSTRPDLPDDDDELCRILGGVPDDVWAEHNSEVRKMFQHGDVNGIKVLWQSRLRKDWTAIESYREEQRAKATKGWQKRQKGQLKDSAAMPQHATALHEQSSGVPGIRHEVVGIKHEVDKKKGRKSGTAKAVPSLEQDFKNLKIQNSDCRFQAIKEYYETEFKARNAGVNARFDGGDAKNLASLLKSQHDKTVEELISWLRNAFDSEGTYPLLPAFRLKQFCPVAASFAKGPLKKYGGAKTRKQVPIDSATQDAIDRLLQ
ncbi:MAG TPA: hypothetical protein VN875_18890 [Candidatus Binatus sp.]|nr:hypothetical protein [Candidatus Binatus sp.]